MSNEHQPATHDAAPEIVSPGAQLRAARQQAGWTAERLAAELGLPLERMHALERDEHDSFGGIVFVRGYLRRAAVLLGIPAAGLIAAYEACCNETRPAEIIPGLPPGRLPGRGVSGWAGPAAGAIAIVAVAAATWWLTERAGPVAPAVQQAARSQPAGLEFSVPREPDAPLRENLAGPAEETAQRAADSDDVGEPAPERIADAASEAPGTEPESSAPDASSLPESVPPPTATMVAAAPESAIPPPGTVDLRLEFTEDCWLEVTDALGRRLAYRLYRAGDVARLRGKAPATVFLGNADGVRMTVDETPIPVRPARRDGTARLTVGGGAG